MEKIPIYGESKQIRSVCLNPALTWTQPSVEEIRTAVAMSGYSQEEFAKKIKVTGRTVRRWVSGEKTIPYAAWCILCNEAGLGKIWK